LIPRSAFELPPEKERARRSAVRLEWLTIAYLISAVVAIYLTLGASQAMKAVWYEDLISLVPAIAFLVGDRIRRKRPNAEFPYGYHGAISISYFAAAMALAALGLYIFYDSFMKFISFEHPPVGSVQPFGDPVWLGWFMLPALVWSAVPAVILGRRKIPLARELHDKVLFADAEMNKADWMTAVAGMIGVIGIGLGIWWADSAAAMFISLDIIKDGFKNVHAAVTDLMHRRPKTVDGSAVDSLVARAENELKALDWVDEAEVRLWTSGHVFFGDAQVVPRDERNLVRRVEEATKTVLDLDWRMHQLAVVVVHRIGELEEEGVESLEPGNR
jgi:divalent metal cation (Fe/Co/Zn/Cd) transporter